MTTTKYIYMKRCLNCFHIQEIDNKRCTQCKFLFTVPANELEKQEANDKLIKMQERAKLK